MKKIKILIVILFLLGVLYLPVEVPINPQNLPDGEYIIVKYNLTTETEWCIYGDQDGWYSENSTKCRYVNLIGITPIIKYNSNVVSQWSDVYFICFVSYIGKSQLVCDETSVLDTYEVTDCKVVGRIERDNMKLFNLRPKSYVCLWDLLDRDRTSPVPLIFVEE